MGWIYWPMLPTPGLLIVAVSEVLLVLRWKMDWDGVSSTKCWNTARYCNFNSKIGLLDVENHLQVVGSFVFLWCFWYQIHSKSILQPHVIHVIPWPKLPRILWVFRRLALWHSCPTPSTMVEHLGRDFDTAGRPLRRPLKWQGFCRFLHGQMGDQAIFLACNDYYEL